jgi:two-component system LytT family sensor kinase
LDVPEDLHGDEVPTFLLQPLVENAVRYAVAERPAGGRVRVRARAAGHSLHIDVEDDGPGLPESVLRGEGWGVGLANVRARLTTLFEAAGELRLGRSELGGAAVHITLPRDTDDDPRDSAEDAA